MRWIVAFGSLLVGRPSAHAQPPQPPAGQYSVLLRYHIPATRNLHVVIYDSLIEHLKKIDFEFDPPLEEHPDTDREDPTKNMLAGKIASTRMLDILKHDSVAAFQVIPEGYKLPEDVEKPARLRLELSGGLDIERQRAFRDQVRLILNEFGFREATAYDSRGYTGRPLTRLVGTFPVNNLDYLLKDIRRLPGGWLGPQILPADLPLPLRNYNPIRIIEVLPDDQALVEPLPPEPREGVAEEKISGELWKKLADKDAKEPIRIQAVFAGFPTAEEMRAMLAGAATGFVPEGNVGNITTGLIPPSQVKAIAALPRISVVRMPHAPLVEIDPAIKLPLDVEKVLASTGLDKLHAKEQRGQGVRVVVIDRSFRGWKSLLDEKKLPHTTRLIDLTAERTYDAVPYPDEGEGLGHGAIQALTVAQAAPAANLLLIRIDPTDPHAIEDVARYLRGGELSLALTQRARDMQSDRAIMLVKRGVLQKERQIVLDDFKDESDLINDFYFLGAPFGWVFSDREYHRQKMATHERLERLLSEREARVVDLFAKVREMKGFAIVVNPYGWNEGYAAGAASPLAASLDRYSQKGPLWFQPAGDQRRQAWHGLWRDDDRNGILEFASPSTPLPKGRWSRELNFLTWQPWEGNVGGDLPEKAKLRIALQWRESHDADYYLRPAERDLYLQPLADLRVTLVRQRDPEAKALPADAFDVVARNTGLPQRIAHDPTGSVYEQILEVDLEKAGRYALQIERPLPQRWILGKEDESKRRRFELIEGLTTSGTRPVGTPALPELDATWELRPRLFVEVGDEATRSRGRIVLDDWWSENGALGMPTGAQTVISVIGRTASLAKRRTTPVGVSRLGEETGIFMFDAVGVGHGSCPTA
ncbi:MAG: hypothetical protein U0744_07020 [Gemmataceae bacterium]